MKRSTLHTILKDKIAAGIEHVTRDDENGKREIVRIRSTVDGRVLAERELGNADIYEVQRQSVAMVEEYCKTVNINPKALDKSDPLGAQLEEVKAQLAKVTKQLADVVTAKSGVDQPPKTEDPFDALSDEDIDALLVKHDIEVSNRVQRPGKIKALKAAGVERDNDDDGEENADD